MATSPFDGKQSLLNFGNESSDEHLPSLFSRLPPDGHEFPSSYEETADVSLENAPSLKNSLESRGASNLFNSEVIEPPCGFEDIECHSNPTSLNNDDRTIKPEMGETTHSTNIQEIMCEKVSKKLSVRDKIALFTKAQQQQQEPQPKIKSPGKSSGTNSSEMIKNPTEPPEQRPSSSMSSTSSSDDIHRSMYSLLESRKKTVNKLKGLVIPQKPDDVQMNDLTPITPDLPLIFSVDSIRLPKVEPRYPADHVVKINDNFSSLILTPPPTSTSNVIMKVVDVPKYSPAFKRKPFTLLDNKDKELSTRSSFLEFHQPPPLPKTTPPIVPLSNLQSIENHDVLFSREEEEDNGSAISDDFHMDAEDQESGISSIESPNVSIHNTPPGSPKELHLARLAFSAAATERGLSVRQCATKHQGSTSAIRKTSLTSDELKIIDVVGCSPSVEDADVLRVLKMGSIEAINRRNVLQSSRSRCGGADAAGAMDKSFKQPSSVDCADDLSPQKRFYSHRRQMSLDDLDCKSDESNDIHKSMGDLTAGDSSNITSEKAKSVSDERWSELAKKYGKSTENILTSSSLLANDNKINKPTDWMTKSTLSHPTTNRSKLPGVVTTYSKEALNDRCPIVNLRQKKPEVIVARRPLSLVDQTDSMKHKLTWDSHVFAADVQSSPIKLDKRLDSLVKNVTSQKQDVINGARSRRSTSFNDLRLIFENQAMTLPTHHQARSSTERNVANVTHGGCNIDMSPNHIRMSSLDSTASGDSDVAINTQIHYGSTNSLGSIALDHYGSITSLASSTSLISPQELQQLIDEANQSLEESGTPSHEITVVVLQREIPGGSIGITLAGGADYDCKEITVNKVINGSLADRDGRIQKGDRVLSINGKNLKRVTHREALCILKTPRTDCVLVLSRSKSSSQDVKEHGSALRRLSNGHSKINTFKSPTSRIHSSTATVVPPSYCSTNSSSVSRVSTEIVKDGSGLGFSLEGGKDSPIGDRPLTIKKIFTGGAADKNRCLSVGDEVLSIHGTDVTKMARIEAWNFMRKLPDGVVSLVINHRD